MTCPDCGSSEIRLSRSRRFQDAFQRLRGREPFRCSKCRVRFFAIESPELALGKAAHSNPDRRSLWNSRIKKRLAKRMIVVSIFAVALVIFLIFLRYVTSEQSSSGDSGAFTVRQELSAV
jgi:transcriptional regulator NrdR family protein